MNRMVTATCLAALLSPGIVGGQEQGAVQIGIAAIQAVVPKYAEQFRDRVVRADVENVGAVAAQNLVADRIGLSPARRPDTLRCETAQASTCTLADTDFLITLGEIRISGTQANVTVEVQGDNGSERQPVWNKWWGITLALDRGAWSVVKVKSGPET